MVWPTNSGVIVDLRDQVFTIFLSPAAFIASTFFMRHSSIKGPFLTDLGTVFLRFFAYLLFVRRETINFVVDLFLRVFVPSGNPQGEHPGLPPDDFPSPPPRGWSTGFFATPQTLGRIPIQRALPAFPMLTFSWSRLPTWPMVAMHSDLTLRTSPEFKRKVAYSP